MNVRSRGTVVNGLTFWPFPGLLADYFLKGWPHKFRPVKTSFRRSAFLSRSSSRFWEALPQGVKSHKVESFSGPFGRVSLTQE